MMIVENVEHRRELREVRRLIEEYMVGVELEKHAEVSRLGFRICAKLVDCFEQELDSVDRLKDLQEPACLLDNQEKDRILIICKIVRNLCYLLREQSDLAAAYANVIEFVQVRDLVCLSQALGSIPSSIRFDAQTAGKWSTEQAGLDFDRLTQILRQSIHLLKSINRPSSYQGPSDWLERTSLQRVAGISFPKYMLDLDKTTWRQSRQSEGHSGVEQLCSQLAELRRSMEGQSNDVGVAGALSSSWFSQFVQRTLIETYPLDRFTILISVWQVAVECGHRPLESLIGELVDQIAHEESNSLNEEELMLLTQVGSFWLSYHKRYKTTTSAAAATTGLGGKNSADHSIDDYDEDDDQSLVSSSSASLPNDWQTADSNDTRGEIKNLPAGGLRAYSLSELRSKLRALIDSELLRGSPCILCGHEPSEPLEVLTSGRSCPKCSNPTAERCSISYLPLNWISLSSLVNIKIHQHLAGLTFLSPSEWVRQALMVERDKDLRLEALGRKQAVSERVDISDKFERLVVIRGDDDDDGTNLAASDSSVSSDDGGYANNVSVRDSPESPVDCMTILADFMKVGRASGKQLALQAPSESLTLFRFVARQRSSLARDRVCWIPLCSSDLLLIETRDSSINVRLAGCRIPSSISGPIWRCSARSQLARLPLGCGRMFAELELIRYHARLGRCDDDTLIVSSPTDLSCPLCGCFLEKIKSLADDPMR